MKWRKLAAITAVATICMNTASAVFAEELPHAFWAPDNSYLAALDAGNDANIIQYGLQALDVIRPLANSEQKANIMASRLDQIGLAYERQGQYNEARNCYEEYIPYAQQLDWKDGVRIAQAKVQHYTPVLDLYTKSYDPRVNFYAKNEPESGVAYGVPVDSASKSLIPNASMELVYLEFGDTQLVYLDRAMQAAASKKTCVELAWNVPGEGSQIGSIAEQTGYMDEVAAVLNKYPSVPVYVRFGAEFNAWNDPASAGDYIAAFRAVSGKIKAACPNAAMVWSVALASSWDTNMHEYYPGDEYVDWVGVSLYLQKYLLGQTWSPDQSFNELVFYTGSGADPVLALKELVDTYGDRKPIMVAESGVSHTIRSLGEDATSWSLVRLRQMMYNVPMVYPQVKLMAYFDRIMANEYNDYALESNDAVRQEYLSAIRDETFVQAESGLTPASYSKAGDWIEVSGNSLLTRAYVHTYGTEEPIVNYFIDGSWAGQQSRIPYEATLDISGLSDGPHTLRVATANASGSDISQEYTIFKTPEIKILVNGQTIESDVPPILQNGRTLVPVRVVSNALKADVDWNESTRTVTVSKDGVTLTLQIGNKTMSASNGNEILDVPPQQIDERTLVPFRAVAAKLGATVGWDGESNTVVITTQ